MKTLRLVCDMCGHEKVFRGMTTDAILAAIDESEWQDRAFTATSKRMPKGQVEGRCPACYAAEFAKAGQ